MILVLACAGTAHAGDPPAHVAPFLGDDADNVHAVTGAFGPAKDTTIVVTYSMMGAGSYSGFALVPDAKAKHGQRKLALPRLPKGSLDGAIETALIANLDKDADDELVIELSVQRGFSSPHGGGTYGTREYVVLDWNGKQHVRVTGLEKKLNAKMKDRDGSISGLAEDEVRAALSLPKKK